MGFNSAFKELIAAATYTEGLWNLHPSDFRNTLIYAHTTSRLFPDCDISLRPLTLVVSEGGGFWNLFCSALFISHMVFGYS